MEREGETVWNPRGAGQSSETAETLVVLSCRQGSAEGHFDRLRGRSAVSLDRWVGPSQDCLEHSSPARCTGAPENLHGDRTALAAVAGAVLEVTAAEMAVALPVAVLAAKS